eukprot:s6155_g2.t1
MSKRSQVGNSCNEPRSKIVRLQTDQFEVAESKLSDWPDDVPRLQDAMLAKHGIASRLSGYMQRKIWVTSAYSGLGTFEHVFSRIASQELGGIGLESHFGPFRFWSAFENDVRCQEMLMASKVKPMHLFRDITEQMHGEVVQKLEFIVGEMKRRTAEIKKARSATMKADIDAMSRQCMERLFKEVRRACEKGMTNQTGWCVICQQECPYLPTMADDDIRLEVGGNPCVAFSPQGGKDRWLHGTAVAAAIWFARTAYTSADWMLQECSHLFPSKETYDCAFPPKQGWCTSVLQLSPVDVGAPFRRPRSFSWTVGPRFELLMPFTRDTFLSVCGDQVAASGHDFFVSSQDDVVAELKHLASERHIEIEGIAAHELGRACLPAGPRQRLTEYEAMLSKVRESGRDIPDPILDLSQSPAWGGGWSPMMPSVLCGSLVWSCQHERELLMRELFMALGWPAPARRQMEHDEFPWAVEHLEAYARGRLAKMLGNSIHCKVLGLFAVYALMVTAQKR